MHTICETHAFRRAAQQAGMTEEEIIELIDFLSTRPDAGDEIAGTGGCRKVRVAGRGKGKSGGYRTITFYSGSAMPLYLLTVFSKGERSNLTTAECNNLRVLTRALVEEHDRRTRTSRRQS
jgi:hypothetical protein